MLVLRLHRIECFLRDEAVRQQALARGRGNAIDLARQRVELGLVGASEDLGRLSVGHAAAAVGHRRVNRGDLRIALLRMSGVQIFFQRFGLHPGGAHRLHKRLDLLALDPVDAIAHATMHEVFQPVDVLRVRDGGL